MNFPFLLDLPGFSIKHVTIVNEVILVQACSRTTRSACPDCAQLSLRIHSRYQRTLADLPWSRRLVRLIVQVSRFFCAHPGCPRKTFAEPIGALAERSARRTTRLKEALEHLGLALGGELGSRLTVALGMDGSPDTLLLKPKWFARRFFSSVRLAHWELTYCASQEIETHISFYGSECVGDLCFLWVEL